MITGVMLLYVVYHDRWTPGQYTLLNLANISTSLWVGVWSIDTIETIVACSVIIVLIPTFLFALWVFLYDPKPEGWRYYAIRNAVSFYLGWTIAASILNFGVVLVFYYKLSEKEFLIIFWILVPLLAIGTTITTITAQGSNGFKSVLGAWFTLLWAMGGALVSTLNNKDRL